MLGIDSTILGFAGYGLLLAMIGSIILIAARIRRNRRQPMYILGQLVAVVGGLIVLSHASNQIARPYLAIPLGIVGGMVLGVATWELRTRWSHRAIDLAAVVYIVAFVLLSVSLDWFDLRGVIPAAILVIAALLRPAEEHQVDTKTTSLSDPISVGAAVAFLIVGALVAVIMRYGMLSGYEAL